jgi:hypothetical protein
MLINVGDVVDGALVNAIALAGRRISVAVDGLRGRRRTADLTAAAGSTVLAGDASRLGPFRV